MCFVFVLYKLLKINDFDKKKCSIYIIEMHHSKICIMIVLVLWFQNAQNCIV